MNFMTNPGAMEPYKFIFVRMFEYQNNGENVK